MSNNPISNGICVLKLNAALLSEDPDSPAWCCSCLASAKCGIATTGETLRSVKNSAGIIIWCGLSAVGFFRIQNKRQRRLTATGDDGTNAEVSF